MPTSMVFPIHPWIPKERMTEPAVTSMVMRIPLIDRSARARTTKETTREMIMVLDISFMKKLVLS